MHGLAAPVIPTLEEVVFDADFERRNHYLFRYPAKFHPPVASFLIQEFSDVGDTVLDPFCGSGTLLVEGATANREMVGVDTDPVAAFISTVKNHRLDRSDLGALRDLLEVDDIAEGKG